MKSGINLSTINNKKKGWKFWCLFWFLAFVFLSSWGIFLQYKNSGISGLLGLSRPIIKTLPLSEKREDELFAALDIFTKITNNSQEQTFLILFQNDLEIRPGGGFIGAFGILKTKGEKIVHVDVHDSGVFDSGMSTNIAPPYPMGKLLNINDWEMRDANWYPDFPASAEKVEYFYHLEGGGENFDGIIAVSTDLLPSFLEVTGPITVAGYPGEYNKDNAITKLEYQVEKGYREQGIEKGKRKYVMKDLAKEILGRVADLSWSEKKDFLLVIEKHLDEKDVMIYFKDDEIQDKIRQLGWSGEMKNVEGDYLAMIDANLGALKTDLHMQRAFEYSLDLSGEKPRAKLSITYENTAKEKDWMTSDYLTYLRVYVPEEAWFLVSDSGIERVFGKEFGKKYVGMVLKVPINSQQSVEFEYELPPEIAQNYSLLIQKQSGVGSPGGKIKVIEKDGEVKEISFQLNQDRKFKL